MIVYKITNKITGKLYIGQTRNALKRRWIKHCNESACTFMNKSIKKHGKENFEIKVIARCNSIEEMNHRETYYIKLFNTLAPNGYNLNTGGKEQLRSKEFPIILSQERKDYLSNFMKNKLIENPKCLENLFKSNENRYVSVYCEQNKKTYINIRMAAQDLELKSHSKISDILAGKLRSYKGYTFLNCDKEGNLLFTPKKALTKREQSMETKSKLSIFMKEKIAKDPSCIVNLLKSNVVRAVPVFCVQNNKFYQTLQEAATSLGLKSKSKISDILKGKLSSYKGYTFLNCDKEGNLLFTPKKIKKEAYIPKNKKSIKCNETGQTWDSIASCAKFFNTKRESIARVIRGIRNHYRSLTFSYYQEAA